MDTGQEPSKPDLIRYPIKQTILGSKLSSSLAHSQSSVATLEASRAMCVNAGEDQWVALLILAGLQDIGDMGWVTDMGGPASVH